MTNGIWRADVQGFEEAPEGLWRPVNATKDDSLGGQVSDIARYGHTATILDTGESDPTEVWHRRGVYCQHSGQFMLMY